jgi:PII-like signaling protein
MQIPKDATLLRIFIGESDRWHHQPLYEAGLATLEKIKVIHYRHEKPKPI